jgi:hypothetical protein
MITFSEVNFAKFPENLLIFAFRKNEKIGFSFNPTRDIVPFNGGYHGMCMFRL